MPRAVVFLDRDGVVIRDVDRVTRPEHVEILPGVPGALASLRAAGFPIVIVTNQPVVARGLIDEGGVAALQDGLRATLVAAGADLDAFYFCPHHPNATVVGYRLTCECRKPRPGMLLRAARELDIDLRASFMVGDRGSDVVAGRRAGCRTVLVTTGRHLDPPIESPDDPPSAEETTPDHVCASLVEAAAFILRERP